MNPTTHGARTFRVLGVLRGESTRPLAEDLTRPGAMSTMRGIKRNRDRKENDRSVTTQANPHRRSPCQSCSLLSVFLALLSQYVAVASGYGRFTVILVPLLDPSASWFADA